MALDRRVVVFSFVAAVVAFCVAQDRVTAAGARRYVAMQRAALEGRGQAVTVDEIMTPAVRDSVRHGLLWAAAAGGAGVAAGTAVARRARRE